MICADAVSLTASTASTGSGRWLHVLSHTDPRYGGLSSAVPALVQSLADRSPYQPSLAAFCVPGEEHRPAELMNLGAEEMQFWPVSRRRWLLDGALKQSFADTVQAVDALHVHGLWESSTAVAVRTARRASKPYVLSAHGMLEPWALASKAWKKRLYAAAVERSNVGGAACLHALTAAEAEQYRHFGARGPIAVVPNAVEVPSDREASLFFDRFPALRGKRIVLFLSRLHPKKGLDLLAEAWKAVAPHYPEAHLVIAGPDHAGMASALQTQFAGTIAGTQVTFCGMLAGDLKWSALEAASLYVLPSYSEGLSMALLEAMAVGLPVIATHACNMPEISASGAGWEIDATAAALTAALREALNASPASEAVMGRRGANLIAERYSLAHVTRAMAEVYGYVLGGPAPASLYSGSGGAA